MSRYVIKKRKNGDYQFNLESDTGNVIFTSETFTTKKNCKKGIKSVKNNALNPKQYERKKEDESSYFILKSQQGKVMGMSQSYKTESGFENAILTVMQTAPHAPMDDQSIMSK